MGPDGLNFLSVIFLLLFTAPVLTGLLLPLTESRMLSSISRLIHGAVFLAAAGLSALFTASLFSDRETPLKSAVVAGIPVLGEAIERQDYLAWIFVFVTALLIGQSILRLAAAPLVGPDTAVLPLLNGADNNEILKEALPPCKVLNGCVYISARIEAPGVVVQSGGNCKLFFGAPGAGAEEFRPLEEMFKRAGIDATLARNIDEEVWTKFIFLSPFAGVTSLFGKNFGEVLSGADSRPMLEGMMKEIRTLAGLRGVSLPGDIVEQSLAKGEAFPPDTKSSMQLDCERGKRTEIEPLLGFVVREGERLGADVPLTRGVYDALRMRMELPCGGEAK